MIFSAHHSMQPLVALTNRKVPWRPYLLTFPCSVMLSTSSYLLEALCMVPKSGTCRKYSVMEGDSRLKVSHQGRNVQPDSQRTYQIVLAATRDMGIGRDGKLPWQLPSDLKFFKEITTSTSDLGKKNAVIMGRKTWESIPIQYRPLPGRLNVVLSHSRTFDIATTKNVITCRSIPSALELLATSPYSLSIDKVFVIGGGQILREAINGPGCEAIHMTEIDASIDCDTFIPPVDISIFRPWYSSLPVTENDIRYCFVSYVRVRESSTTPFISYDGQKHNSNLDSKVENFDFLPKMIFEKHEEFMYLRLVEQIILSGNVKDDGTGTETRPLFGCQMHFNLRKSFPLLTTKTVFWHAVVEELLWFVSGSTNAKGVQNQSGPTKAEESNQSKLVLAIFSLVLALSVVWDQTGSRPEPGCHRIGLSSYQFHYFQFFGPNSVQFSLHIPSDILQEMGIHMSDRNASRDYLDSIGLKEREEGNLGPIYGFQWRHFGARYTNMHANYTGRGFDQLLDVIDKCKNKCCDRRIVLSAWNPSDLKLMALLPCHIFAQFYVANGELSCKMYQGSADMSLGVPFEIASCALLTCMIAHVSGLVPGDFIHVIGDAHVYGTHIGSLQKQLRNLPKPFPFLKINPQKKDIDSFVAADFELIGYDLHHKSENDIAL